MCMLKTGTKIFTVTGERVKAANLPALPNEWAKEFEVTDTKAGRSAVAKALNHGNSRIPFKMIREKAWLYGWVDRPRYFQGIVFSDAPAQGTERYIIAKARPALFKVDDAKTNGSWHVFPLGLGDHAPETAADFATRFSDGEGFLMKSCDGSVIFAVYHSKGFDQPYWQVYGGGGNAYLHFMEEGIKDAKVNGCLIHEA